MLTLRTSTQPTGHLRADAAARPIRVDKAASAIRGYVLAKSGPFKDDRGAFDNRAVQEVVRLVNEEPLGLRSRFGHPPLFGDSLGTFLGRVRGAWVDKGSPEWVARADLYLAKASRETPRGDLGGYVLNLAAEDPDALSTSLVLLPDVTERRSPLPPLWHPKRLFATDVVDTGAAVDGILGHRPRPTLTPKPSASPSRPQRSARPPWAPAPRSLPVSGLVAFFGISSGPICLLPTGRKDGLETAGRPVLMHGCFRKSLLRHPVPLYLKGVGVPIATTSDHTLTIREGRTALEVQAHISSPGVKLLLQEPPYGRRPLYRFVPQFDLSTARLDHAFGKFYVHEATLDALLLTDRGEWYGGFAKIGR